MRSARPHSAVDGHKRVVLFQDIKIVGGDHTCGLSEPLSPGGQRPYCKIANPTNFILKGGGRRLSQPT